MRVLAIVAHPDDESFFAGGTLALHALNGDEVTVLTLSDGESSRMRCEDVSDAIRKRYREYVNACAALGADGLSVTCFPDQQSDTVPQLTINLEVERVVRRIDPAIVYTHHVGDLNLDHRRVAEAVLVETRGGARVRCMTPEWPSRCVGRPFEPSTLVALPPPAIEAKVRACLAYAGELRPYPHPRSELAVRERAVEAFMEIA